MFIINAIKWLVIILVAITLIRVVITKKGGWETVKQSVSEKVHSWFEIPVIGKPLRIIVKGFRVVFTAMWNTLKWIATLPIICTVIAVTRKIWRMIVQKWTQVVAWSETE